MATILIVEDRAIDRRLLATLLKSTGHDVVEACDGVEALRLAERVTPDVVISDILMPTIDGYELVRRMRDIPSLTRTPVIFYTATYHEREAWNLAQQYGVADILTKPSTPKAILAKINALLTTIEGPAAARPDPARFAQAHVQVVNTALASKIKEFEESEQRMAAIVALAHQIAAERDPRALLDKVCSAARSVTLAQYAVILMRSAEESSLQQVVSCGLDTAALNTESTINRSMVHTVIEDRRPLRTRNLEGRADSGGSDHPAVSSSLIAPIASATRVYGCLELRNKLGADGFSDKDEEIALALVTHAGTAYENARLYDDLRRRTAALEHEVADRRRAEVALRESDERVQFALSAARIGVWQLDFSTRVVIWSDTMAPVFGLLPHQAPTNVDEFAALTHPDDRARIEKAMRKAFRDGGDCEIECRVLWPDQSVHHAWARARVVRDDDGMPIGLLGVGMDISQRQSLEERLRQAQKMEAVGQLAGGVAHDFNNLLTAIGGYADLLLATLEPADERRGRLDEIISAADRAAGLTRQLLAFSRKQVLQPRLLDLNSLVTETGRMLRRLIGEDIELVTTLAATGVLVRADPGQLEQILMNLAVNARDAMPDGGRLSIETTNVLAEDLPVIADVAVRPGAYVMLSVSDTGIGMDEPTRRRIFEPFFTTKERGRGTGLGLATVYGIVEQSGGFVWVASEPNRGATFKVYLPRADVSAVPERLPLEHELSSVYSGGSETILLVEDEDTVRTLARLLLERAGYRVIDAGDPDRAQALFREHHDTIDLLLTDVVMPGSSGPSLFQRLSAQQPGLKVVYTSGYIDVHSAGLGSDSVFLQKPFTAHGLLSKVREAFER